MNWFKAFWQELKKSMPSGQVEQDPFGNLTPRAQRVLELARHEAARLNHSFVGTEHVLLGILSLGQGCAFNVMQKAGFDLEGLRTEVEKTIGTGPAAAQAAAAPLSITPRAKTVLSLAHKEAKALNHLYVGTEHLLLGLLREEEGVAARVLKNLGADLATLRQWVLRELDPNASSNEEPQKGQPNPNEDPNSG